ncbi:hypothetical protein [Rhodococcus qingshengii]|uniref:hypothetical protein n=1 Tax=Rhodococcus qingshengii TaxID=334542 RepID=UPI003019E9BC
MTNVRITVSSEQLGNTTIDLDPITRDVGENERDCIERLLEDALRMTRRAYELKPTT